MFELIFPFFIILYLFNLLWVSLKYSVAVFAIHPINIFSIYLSVFFILPQFFDSYYIVPGFGYLEQDLDSQNDFLILMVLITYLIVTCITVLTRKSNVKKIEVPIQKYGNVLEIFISIYLFIIIVILMLLIFTSEGSVLNNIAEFVIKLRNGNAFLLNVIYTVEILPIIYLLLSKRVNKFFLVLVTIISMMVVIAVGARTLILSIILGLVILGVVYRKINVRKLFLIGIVFSMFFILGSVVRNSGEDVYYSSLDDKVENLQTYFFNNADQLFTSLYVMDRIEKGNLDHQYGATLVDAVYFFIPTAIWKNKPRSYYPSRLVFPDTIQQGVESNTKQTINFGMIARPFLDFGIIGVFIINALTAFILVRIFNRVVFYNKSLSTKNLIIYVYIYSHIPQIYILGSWSHVISIILFNFVFIGIVLFFFKRFRNLFKQKNF